MKATNAPHRKAKPHCRECGSRLLPDVEACSEDWVCLFGCTAIHESEISHSHPLIDWGYSPA